MDKLPFLSKIDAYLASKGIPSVDRGSKEAQGAVEIKRIRDAFVHPKRKRHTAMRINAADELSFNLVFPKHKATGISTSPSHWGKEDVLKALTMSIAFIRHVLKDRLRLPSEDAFLAVSSSIILGKDQGFISETELCDTVDDAKKMRIDLSFLIPADIVDK